MGVTPAVAERRASSARFAAARSVEVRSFRAEARRQIAALEPEQSRALACAVLRVLKPEVETATVMWLLTSCRGIATLTAMEICAEVPCSEGRRLGDLTERQRDRIIELLEGLT